nr:mannan synthase 1-like [Tanacetum cinerariifolium]
MTVVVLLVKLTGKKKYMQYKLEALKEDIEKNRSYPMVLVQIPMFNEKEVYKLSIGSVCSLKWPSDRLIVQVLDDSTNEVLRKLVELECKKWIERGVNVKYETRNNRNGYKVGALREGLNKEYVDCEFVVIFDADFQPDEDFLWRSLHLLVFWILFENVMSFHRSKATIIGLVGANRVNEWIVTEKLGNATKQKSNIIKPPKRSRSRFAERLHFSELLMGLFLLYVACYDMIFVELFQLVCANKGGILALDVKSQRKAKKMV